MDELFKDRQPGVTATGIVGALTLTKTGTTARTATFPDAAITVAGQNLDNAFSASQTLRFATGSASITPATLQLGSTDSSSSWLTNTNWANLDFYSADSSGPGASVRARVGARMENALGSAVSLVLQASGAGGLGTASVLDSNGNWLMGGAVTCSSTLSATSLTASGLTSGRVPYVTTGGLLTDSANFAFTTASGLLSIGSNAQAFQSRIDLNSAAGYNRGLLLQTGGASRWFLFADTATESGSDAGSTLTLRAYTDAGASIDSPLTIVRAAGGAITLARPVTCTSAVTVPNGTAAAPGIRLTSEASGLYRFGATSIGISVAGASSVRIAAPSASNWGGNIFLENPAADQPSWMAAVDTASYFVLGGSFNGGLGVGSQVRLFQNTHATKADYVEFTRGVTVSAYFDGSGIFTLNNITDATTTSDGSVRLSGGLSVAAGKSIVAGGQIQSQSTATGGYAFLASGTATLGAGIGDGYLSGFASAPVYNGAFTVTRHNYIQMNNPTGAATITDACAIVFNAAIGTHKAVDSGTTKTSPGTVTAWVKININGTVHYMPAYASKTT